MISSRRQENRHSKHLETEKLKFLLLLTSLQGNYRCITHTLILVIGLMLFFRGLDIPEIDLVIQTAPPKDIDSYIHRSGRTGRAGKHGACICLYKSNQVTYTIDMTMVKIVFSVL